MLETIIDIYDPPMQFLKQKGPKISIMPGKDCVNTIITNFIFSFWN